MTTLTPDRAEDVVAAVQEHVRIVPHGGLTKKPLLADVAAATRIDMTGLAGVTEYDPGEFTFSARAGTPLRDIEMLLAANGQHMPFDPPFIDRGATIGGTVAAGLNGPGRLRYGGLRDFIIGVRFVDGTGRLVRGGGRVVKNAAGFDLPKLMIGSMGRLGVIVDVTFKVFPAPQAWRTVRVSCGGIEQAVALMARLGRQPLDLEALDIEPPATLVIRVSGPDPVIDVHAARVGKATGHAYDVIAGDLEANYWQSQRAFAWVHSDEHLIKVPLTVRRLASFERVLAPTGVSRRYSVGGNVAWLAWPADRPLEQLDLDRLSGLVVSGPPLGNGSPWLGAPLPGIEPFAARVKHALDPQQRLSP